ncbi:MAG: hypothetical protein WAN62_02230, partial [Candidatus Acidiferrum sp.]
LSSGSATHAQTDNVVTISSSSGEELARASQDIYATPESLTLLPHTPEAHTGKIWLRSSDDGVHVWGKIDADEQSFHWPRQKSEMLSSDHLEVWLATSPEVPMPEIGWGNQFGPTLLANLKDCAGQVDSHKGEADSGAKNCERWFTEQLQFRKYLRRLFVRQWLIAGSGYSDKPRLFEDFASSAYAGLSAIFFSEDVPKTLKPESNDGVTADIVSDVRSEKKRTASGRAYTYYRRTGYHFHVFIPYKAFPPAQQLTLTDLYLMVDAFSSAPAGHKMGDYSSTSAKRQWGRPATFNHVRLALPRTFSVGPCECKLEQKDIYGETYPSWFFPPQSAKDSDLRSTFALINPAGGYMYKPANVSPEVIDSDYFWKQLTNGATVCGPDLGWRYGNEIKRTEFGLDGEHFETLALPDGWTLIRSGPTASTLSAFGSGACGACPVLGFDIFAVSPQGEITSALAIREELTGTGGQPSEADLTIAPDWKQIILYLEIVDPQQTENTTGWTSTTYCLEDHVYKQCSESKQTQPPEPPHFKEFRNE